MRAFYFASLAQLAARGLITVAKFKSNRDYERELQRRGHSLPELLASFGDNVSVFDRTWYRQGTRWTSIWSRDSLRTWKG